MVWETCTVTLTLLSVTKDGVGDPYRNPHLTLCHQGWCRRSVQKPSPYSLSPRMVWETCTVTLTLLSVTKDGVGDLYSNPHLTLCHQGWCRRPVQKPSPYSLSPRMVWETRTETLTLLSVTKDGVGDLYRNPHLTLCHQGWCGRPVQKPSPYSLSPRMV